MASLNLQQPSQVYFTLPDGLNRIGVHKVTLVSTQDSLTVPVLAVNSNNASSAQVRRVGDASVTVTDDGANTVTIVGSPGDEALIVTVHPIRSSEG